MAFYYIGEEITTIKTGGDAVNKQNIKLLRNILKNEFNIINIKHDGKLYTFINLLFNYLYGLSELKVLNILKVLYKDRKPIIFIPSSKMGKICKRIKEKIPEAIIIIFYHNIEKQYINEEYRISRTLKNFFIKKVVCKNELTATIYGDYHILLNKRDAQLFHKYYNKTPNLILPLALPDKYNKDKRDSIKRNNTDQRLKLLFVGSAFFANIQGIEWFIKNVFPHLKNCTLTIVGNNMDSHFKNKENIIVHGFIEDLSTFYYNSDIVISPIFSGGGMKTKTAEALMFGLPIIGTNEAFEGYTINYKEIGDCCNTASEMIEAINSIEANRNILNIYSDNSRNIYINNYSEYIIQNKLNTFLNNI